MTGWVVKPRIGTDPCSPTLKRGQCVSCARLSPALPADPEQRPRTLLLDGSFAVLNGTCTLFIPHIPTEHAPVRIARSARLEFRQ